jgi:hypothetical protein
MVHAVDTPMPVNFTPNDHGYPAQFNTVTTPTQISVTGNGVCTAQGGAHYSKVSGTVLKTLSNEDTEIDAIARASTTPGSSCTAAIEPRGAADFTFNFVAVSYDLSCARLAPGGSYIATVELLTEDYGGGNPVVSTQDYPFTASGVTHLIADVIVCPSGSQVTVQNATIVSD